MQNFFVLLALGLGAVWLCGRREFDNVAEDLNDAMGLAGDYRTAEERTDNEGGW